MVVVKPPGQFTQGSWAPPDEITLETAVRQYLDPGAPSSVYLGIVHRLDRPTSGVLIWAKTTKAAQRLSIQFQRRRVVKEYWAIVESTPQKTGLEYRRRNLDRLAHTRLDAKGSERCPAAQPPGAREAITKVHFEAAGSLASQFTWLRLRPETGRTHQLRAQAAVRGMPILGDSAYGSTLPSPLPGGIGLHARVHYLLKHPITGRRNVPGAALLSSTWDDSGFTLPVSEILDGTKKVFERPDC